MRLKLSKHGLALLKKSRGKLSAVAAIVARDAAGNTGNAQRKLKLRLARR